MLKLKKQLYVLLMLLIANSWCNAYASGMLLAYVANSISQTVQAYNVNSDGNLTAIGHPVYTGNFPTQVVIPFYGRFAFVTGNGEMPSEKIAKFNLSSKGLITSETQLIIPDFPVYSIVIGPHAKLMYFLGFNQTQTNELNAADGTFTESSVSMNTVTSMSFYYFEMSEYTFSTLMPDSVLVNKNTDSLAPELNVLQTGYYPVQTKFAGDYAYVLSRGDYGVGNEISAYWLNSTAIIDLGAVETGLHGIVHMEIADEPFGNLLFVINELNNIITVYKIDHVTGDLTQIQRLQAPINGSDNRLTSIVVNPVQKYVYITQTGANRVLIYTIAPDGQLLSPPRTVPTGYYPSSITLHMF